MDLFLSILLLVASLPLILVVALAIKLDSPGPVLFKQRRLGKDGREFTMYKFRSMRWNSDDTVHRQAIAARLGYRPSSAGRDGSQEGELLPFAGLPDDPRVTRIGRFLRKTGLDELPQLINVLKGEMSLVGPRPPLLYEAELYEDWHRARLAAVPGITGLWQIRGRGRVSFDEMVKLDIEYIDNWSVWLDLKILILTLPALLVNGQGGRGHPSMNMPGHKDESDA